MAESVHKLVVVVYGGVVVHCDGVCK